LSNILARAVHSLHEGTFQQKLAVRRHMVRHAILKRLDWLMWVLGAAPWQSAIKAWYLRRQGARVGRDLFMERAVIVKGADGLRMGDRVMVGSFSLLTCSGGLTIEDEVNISTGCRVLTGNHRVLPGVPIRDSGHDYAPVHLKKGCWLATNAIVVPGVTIGEGAVVTAGSLVVSNVPDYAYFGGVPARFMMYRKGYRPPES